MKEIDLKSWNRKDHFEFFRRMDLPFYNINVNMDITGLHGFTKSNKLSMNNTIIHLTMRSLLRIENFKYRLRGDTVVLLDSLNPSFAHLKRGDDLFRMITVDFCDDIFEFDRAVKKEIEHSNAYFDFQKLVERDDFVFISPLPWISFTGIDHTLNFKKDDAIPRIAWGKYYENNGRILLPFNIQVNHIFVDGTHVARFIEDFNREIAVVTGAAGTENKGL
jgi:chloramphenicol O-acetyltransferase type A